MEADTRPPLEEQVFAEVAAAEALGDEGIEPKPRLKLVPNRSTSSEPTNRRLMPPSPSTSRLVSKSSRSADGSPLSKHTEAAKLSNWRPAEAVAVEVEFVAKVGDDEVDDEKSKMSSSLLFPLLTVLQFVLRLWLPLP